MTQKRDELLEQKTDVNEIHEEKKDSTSKRVYFFQQHLMTMTMIILINPQPLNNKIYPKRAQLKQMHTYLVDQQQRKVYQ